MKFCTTCGKELKTGLKFCTHCGTQIPMQGAPETDPRPSDTSPRPERGPEPVVQATGAAASQPAQQWQPLMPPAPAPPAAAGNGKWLRTAIIALSMVALVAAIGIGGLVYVGYKVKQKATAMLHKSKEGQSALSRLAAAAQTGPGADTKPGAPAKDSSDPTAALLGDLSKMLGSAASNGDPAAGEGDPVPTVTERDPVEPCPAAPMPPQEGARVPLQKDTVITTAWGVKYQDVESRIAVGGPAPGAFTTSHSTSAYKDDSGREQKATAHDSIICNTDVASAGTYVTVVGSHIPALIHGITRLRVSDRTFAEVKSSGKTNFEYLDFMQVPNGVKPTHDAGVLARVEPQDVPYPMILNDERTTLPAIHLAGVFESKAPDPRAKKWRPNHSQVDLYVLDDPSDPLVLLWKDKDPVFHDGKFRVEVVKIDFKIPHPINTVEKQLSEQKRAVTYGIYFDFNKDTIKPESEPVLKQIVQAMSDNPSWKLTVEGHTDNIGGDSYNLDLSKRRAAAVKQVLVARYHISADRLSTDGFGASRPVETNETLEGRARNRRVELTRE